MAERGDEVQTSDVALWGIIAITCWAVAVLSANLAALVPPSITAALHASRLEGASLNQLRSQFAALQDEAARMRQANLQLNRRFGRAEDSAAAAEQRLAALEITVPALVEEQRQMAQAPDAATLSELPADAVVDPVATGSIASDERELIEVDGGSMTVTVSPLPLATPLPDRVHDPIGVALGAPLGRNEAPMRWEGYQDAAPSLLAGLLPRVTAMEAGGAQLVAGPIDDVEAGETLCTALESLAISCAVTDFAGEEIGAPPPAVSAPPAGLPRNRPGFATDLNTN